MTLPHSCIPCERGSPALTAEAAEKFLTRVEQWELIDNAGKIQRRFAFANFVLAMNFLNKLALIAEQEFHHPDMTVGWGYCKVVFYTHKINGLHENDFIMANKANEIYDHESN